MVDLFIVPIIIQLIFHPQKNKSRAGNPDCQSKNVEKTIGPVFPEISNGYFEKIFEHRLSFMLDIFSVLLKQVLSLCHLLNLLI